MLQTIDRVRDTQRQRQAFAKVRLADRYYGTQLRKIAKTVGDLVGAFHPEDPAQLAEMRALLGKYSDLIRPWSRAVAKRMLADVSRRDARAWALHARTMGQELQREIEAAPVGDVFRQLLDDQVHLITSLPTEAGRRVHELVAGNLYTGARARTVAEEVMRTGEVTLSRATLIARTETARAASTLTQVRATAIGSEGYVWRTARDKNVRLSHRKMEGKFIRWDDPPEVDPGYRYHAGMFPNCRCVPDPVLPQKFD